MEKSLSVSAPPSSYELCYLNLCSKTSWFLLLWIKKYVCNKEFNEQSRTMQTINQRTIFVCIQIDFVIITVVYVHLNATNISHVTMSRMDISRGLNDYPIACHGVIRACLFIEKLVQWPIFFQKIPPHYGYLRSLWVLLWHKWMIRNERKTERDIERETDREKQAFDTFREYSNIR